MVISIIALLIGILLPALGAARATARDAQCLSNVRQVGIASMAYTVDNKDYYVRAVEDGEWNSNAITSKNRYWTSALALGGYGADRLMFKCPSFETLNYEKGINEAPDDFNDADFYYWKNVDYGVNYSYLAGRAHDLSFTPPKKPSSNPFLGSGNVPRAAFSVRTGDVRSTTETVFSADSWFELFKDDDAQQRGNGVIGAIPTAWGSPNGRHSNLGVSTSWADGHAGIENLGSNEYQDEEGGPYADIHFGRNGGDPDANKWDLK